MQISDSLKAHEKEKMTAEMTVVVNKANISWVFKILSRKKRCEDFEPQTENSL